MCWRWHLGDVLVKKAHHDDREGREEQVVESLIPIIVQALPTVACIDIEPELGKGVRHIFVEKVPAQ